MCSSLTLKYEDNLKTRTSLNRRSDGALRMGSEPATAVTGIRDSGVCVL
jgi:hypothetical protein